MKKYTLSKKKIDTLYKIIDDDIMGARIRIARLLNDSKIGREVDNILYDLSAKAPQKAIDLFEKKEGE